jgi:hypothetical protein
LTESTVTEATEEADSFFQGSSRGAEKNSSSAAPLLATGELILKSDHHQEPNAPAPWRYFEILTEIRRELAATPPRDR